MSLPPRAFCKAALAPREWDDPFAEEPVICGNPAKGEAPFGFAGKVLPVCGIHLRQYETRRARFERLNARIAKRGTP